MIMVQSGFDPIASAHLVYTYIYSEVAVQSDSCTHFDVRESWEGFSPSAVLQNPNCVGQGHQPKVTPLINNSYVTHEIHWFCKLSPKFYSTFILDCPLFSVQWNTLEVTFTFPFNVTEKD